MPFEPKLRVQLSAGQRRGAAHNHPTLLALDDDRKWRADFRHVFEGAYDRVRRECLDFGHVGLAIVAVDMATNRTHGVLCLEGQPGTISTAVLGRHAQADLFLDADPSLALRHLLFVVHPLSSWDAALVRFSILDLRTRTAFTDEHGNALEGLVAEGPVFLHCGRYALLVLVTGNASDFPESAANAWDFIPDRVFLKHESAEPDRWTVERRAHLARHEAREPSSKRSGRETTHVTLQPHPVFVDEFPLDPTSETTAILTLHGPHGRTRLRVGPEGLRRGILLGRYDRCDAAGMLSDNHISRVHALIRSFEGRTFAIDARSTHGTKRMGDSAHDVPSRVIPLTEPTQLVLAHDAATVAWEPTPGKG